jgi:hypothetical protein
MKNIIIIAACLALASCTGHRERVEIKVTPDRDNKVAFKIAARAVTIDWGDGSVEKLAPREEREITHRYTRPGPLPRVITLAADSLARLGTDHYEGNARQATSTGDYHEIRLGNCPHLEEIYCPQANETLALLEIKHAPSLASLDCSRNRLETLDLAGCPALATLDCSRNRLTSLDTRACPALEWLQCSGNLLEALDASGCTVLRELDCSRNRLTSLYASEYSDLVELDCSGNQLTADALNTLFTSLSPSPHADGLVTCHDNPGFDSCDTTIAEDKGWSIALTTESFRCRLLPLTGFKR